MSKIWTHGRLVSDHITLRMMKKSENGKAVS